MEQNTAIEVNEVRVADDAIAKLELALALEPRNPQLHNDLGVLYFNAGDIACARECFQSAVDCDDSYVVAKKNLADLLVQLGEHEAALRMFQGVLGHEPDDVYSLISAGGLLFHAKRFSSAAYHLKRALALEPTNESALTILEAVEREAPQQVDREPIKFVPNVERNQQTIARYESGINSLDEKGKLVGLKGFDPDGEVFLKDGKVYRGIFSGKGARVKKVLQRCHKNNLFDFGIVQTAITESWQFSEMKYDLVLEHARVPFISYAHEWTPSMLKDAALFQLELNSKLLDSGLLLKDCGVTTNVLFDGTTPTFVDFLSIIESEELIHEDWLKSESNDSRFSQRSEYFKSIFERMFNPCALFPLYMYKQNDVRARKRLLETALNTTNDTMTERETFSGNALHSMFRGFHAAKESALLAEDWKQFLEIQRQEIRDLNVAQTESGYSDYYQLKGEDFPFEPSPNWKMKQKGVYSALKALAPSTVLDLGANTGWFSILAAKQGAKVVALDNDVACMDLLYRRAKDEKLSILPLIVDFLNPTADIPALVELRNDPHMLQSQLVDDSPLLLSADKRLQCDMVMALALIHHLCLGGGRHVDDVVRQMARYANEHLVLEFVTKDDPLIVAEPTFFKAYNNNRNGFEWYTLEGCKRVLSKHFATIDSVELAPSRILLVCTDKFVRKADTIVAETTTTKPKILFTTPVIEHPPAGGPALRIENSIKALGAISELHVAARIPQAELGGAAAEQFYASHSHVFAYTPCLTASRNAADEVRNAKAVVNYANQHDIEIIWCGYGNVSHEFMKTVRVLDPKLKIICDTDSVWSRFVLRELPLETDPERRKKIEAEGKQKEREEAEWAGICDVTTAVSDVDAEYYHGLTSDATRVQRFSNVIDLDSYANIPQRAADMRSPSIYLAGSFYAETSPMVRAARWVIAEVLPKVQKQIPNVTLFCIGSGADRMLADVRNPNVVIKGKVPSVLPYLCHADVALVPLMFESGTRFKILEAAACNIPIVSTTLGAEGIPVTNGTDIIIADEPTSFAQGILTILNDREHGKTLARNCRTLVEEHFSAESLKREARSILRHLGVREQQLMEENHDSHS